MPEPHDHRSPNTRHPRTFRDFIRMLGKHPRHGIVLACLSFTASVVLLLGLIGTSPNRRNTGIFSLEALAILWAAFGIFILICVAIGWRTRDH